jgi:hypothetical protein
LLVTNILIYPIGNIFYLLFLWLVLRKRTPWRFWFQFNSFLHITLSDFKLNIYNTSFHSELNDAIS